MKYLWHSPLVGVILALALAIAAGYGTYEYVNRSDLFKSEFQYGRSNVMSVYQDEGGAVDDYVAKYLRWEEQGLRARFDGFCASACTMFFGLLPLERVCADDHAVFGFHEVSIGGYHDRAWTEWYFAQAYPDWLIEKLKNKGFDLTKPVSTADNPTGLIWFTPEELGVQRCP